MTPPPYITVDKALLREPGLTATDKLLFGLLRDYEALSARNGNAGAFPSIRTLAVDLGASTATVQGGIRRLQKAGRLQIEVGGPTKSSRYQTRGGDESAAETDAQRKLPHRAVETDTPRSKNCHTAQQKLIQTNPDTKTETKPDTKPEGESLPVGEVFDAWNRVAERSGLPTARKLTDSRRKHIRARLADADWRQSYPEALEAVGASGFLCGQKGWRADLDWFLRPDSVTKILEGKYADRQRTPAASEYDGIGKRIEV